MRMKNFTRILSLFLTVWGFLVLFSLVLYLGGSGTSLPAWLGGFLYTRFHLAGFYVPLYLILAGMFLLLPSFTIRRFSVLMGSLIPFLTLGVLLKLLFDPGASVLEAFLIGRFGDRGGAVLLMTLLLIESLVLLRFALGRPETGSGEGPVLSSLAPGKPSRLVEENDPGSLESVKGAAGTETGKGPGVPPQQRGRESSREGEGAAPEGSLSSLFQEGLSPVLASRKEPSPRADYPVSEPDPPEPSENFSIGSEDAGSSGSDAPSSARGVSRGMENLPESLVVDWERDLPSTPEPRESGEYEAFNEEEVGDLSFRETDDFEDDPFVVPEAELKAFAEEDDLRDEESGNEDLEDYPWEASLEEADDSEEPALLEELDPAGAPEEKEAQVLPGHEEGPNPRDIQTAAAVTAKPAPVSKPHPGDTSPDLPPKRGPAKRGARRYDVPVDDILDEHADGEYWIVDDETRRASEILRLTLEEFKIAAEVTGISKGPVITMFEILPAPGVKLSKIVNLADNIALRLAASRVRIVAPIPGKHAVGIEVPNKDRAIVSFKEMLDDTGDNRKLEVPVILGKDITGGARIIDLVQTPHLLIAGATGSGKSVCVNSLICSILYKKKPDEVKLILIDPKIVELKLYNDIPHLLTPVITEPKKAFRALQYAIFEMERRYSLLDTLGVRDIRSYNRRVKEQKLATDPLAYIVIVVDEFADLMATTGKELESTIARLTAMSRAIGIHLVLATQRPSVDVITGLIKANIPSRIAFMVASKFDSRIIIDGVGAEKLLGKGDMLFTSSWDPNPVRIQGAFLSEGEAERVADHVKSLGEPDYIDEEIFGSDDDEDDFELMADTGDDPLLDTAVGIIVEAGKASASYLQRRLKIGYNRAARLVEEMERRGIVGPANGSKPRDILHIPDRSSTD